MTKRFKSTLEGDPLLHGLNICVETAKNGQEGLDRYRARRPDLVITDLLMPRMDGFQLLNPDMPTVFDELEDLLLQNGQAEMLEEQYRRTLLQLRQRNPEWAAGLWKRLTALYHRRLKDQGRARTALEVVRAIKPEEEVLELELELELFPDD